MQEMQETWVPSLGWEDPLEEEMAIHSSTLAWRIPWTEEPGGLQSIGLQSRTQLSDWTPTYVGLQSWRAGVNSPWHLRRQSCYQVNWSPQIRRVVLWPPAFTVSPGETVHLDNKCVHVWLPPVMSIFYLLLLSSLEKGKWTSLSSQARHVWPPGRQWHSWEHQKERRRQSGEPGRNGSQPRVTAGLPCKSGWHRAQTLCVCTCSVGSDCYPMDGSPPGSSVHGILQARTLERVATASSRRPCPSRDWTHISCLLLWQAGSSPLCHGLPGVNSERDPPPLPCLRPPVEQSVHHTGSWFTDECCA